MLDGEFRDLRVAYLYDAVNRWARDDDYFLSELASAPARDVLDLGCGTGRLTVALAARGYRVTGVDPSATSLALAARKPGADPVTWIRGTSAVAPPAAFDAVLMTSHVTQVLPEPLADALADIGRTLRPGGRLIFDSRDPAARRWESWTEAGTRGTVALPDGSTVETWVEVTSIVDDAVTFSEHCVFADGEHHVEEATLRFRSEGTLREALSEAGFTVHSIHGGWNRDPIGHPDGELIVTASRP